MKDLDTPVAPTPKIWLWPNILSLDAPLVAVAWQILFTRAFRARLPSPAVLVLAFGTWLIYVADRILDGLRDKPESNSTARHRFYTENRLRMIPWIGAVLLATVWLSAERLSRPVLAGNFLLGLVVILYFGIVHLAPPAVQKHWPKESIVALLFAAGTTALIWTRLSWFGVSFGIAFSLFAATLWINALGIECWERAPDRAARTRLRPQMTRCLALHLGPAAVLVSVIAAWFAASDSIVSAAWPLYAAIATSALSLAGLEWLNNRMPAELLRLFADLALLSPALFFPFLPRT